jgi:Flp pilus assembly protein TadG
MVLIVAALAALLLMAGLALDVGHATLNKSRLQNATDAAALAAAKILDDTHSTALATVEAFTAFGNNANTTGNQELANAYGNGNGSISLTVQYSATLPPFVAGSPVGPYVRVTANGFTRPTWLVTLIGVNQVTLSATAVAGPSPSIGNSCNLAPMMVCGDPAAGAAGLWGYTLNAPTVLKQSAPGNPSQVGPGNFQLVQLGGSGANIVRQNMAGDYQACINQSDAIQTQPGNETGPTAQGLNTRFGDYSGPMGGTQSQYPPDVIVTQPSPLLTVTSNGSTNTIQQGSTTITAQNINLVFNYATYEAQLPYQSTYSYQPAPAGIGAYNRRILSVPVGDCNGTSGGSTSVPVLGFACFFLLQKAVQQGINSYILGQFVGQCDVDGTPGPAPASGPNPYVIQLYRDPGSGDS